MSHTIKNGPIHTDLNRSLLIALGVVSAAFLMLGVFCVAVSLATAEMSKTQKLELLPYFLVIGVVFVVLALVIFALTVAMYVVNKRKKEKKDFVLLSTLNRNRGSQSSHHSRRLSISDQVSMDNDGSVVVRVPTPSANSRSQITRQDSQRSNRRVSIETKPQINELSAGQKAKIRKKRSSFSSHDNPGFQNNDKKEHEHVTIVSTL